MKTKNNFPRVYEPIINNYAELASQGLCCDYSYLGLPILIAASIAIGSKIRVEITEGWTEGAVVHGVIIGEPASKKSPAVEAAIKPIRQFQIELDADGKYLIITDTTMEALGEVLEENPHGILLLRDEIFGLIKSLNQYKSKGDDVENFLGLNTQTPFIIKRKGKTAIKVTLPFVSILGGLQTGLIQSFQNTDDNGLLERFVFAFPDKTPFKYNPVGIPNEAYEKYKAVLAWIFNKQAGSDLNIIKFSKDAQNAWNSWAAEYEKWMESIDVPSNMRGTCSKLFGFTARFSLIIEYLKCAENKVDIAEVSTSSLHHAIELTQYFAAQAHKVYHSFGANILDKKVDSLVNWLKGRPNMTATARDILNNQVANLKTSDAVLDLFTELKTRGMGQLYSVNAGNGRLKHTFTLILKQHSQITR
ncbi:MAG: YfjI family protein [Sphingobacteriales bacterium JAD_PAG50586_3]|nr:MAG: YfjI family protein [Sphingobacteriales bacterium JAD_PAG50586_3]